MLDTNLIWNLDSFSSITYPWVSAVVIILANELIEEFLGGLVHIFLYDVQLTV